MKTVVFSFVILIITFTAVILNSIFVSKSIEDIKKQLENAPSTTETYALYSDIFDEYMKRQHFIGLTVNHEDLTNIETEFNEILGAIEADDEKSLIIAKSRLIGSLSHLRRLSGINADSIF